MHGPTATTAWELAARFTMMYAHMSLPRFNGAQEPDQASATGRLRPRTRGPEGQFDHRLMVANAIRHLTEMCSSLCERVFYGA